MVCREGGQWDEGRAELATGVEDIQKDVVSAAFRSPEGVREKERKKRKGWGKKKKKKKKR